MSFIPEILLNMWIRKLLKLLEFEHQLSESPTVHENLSADESYCNLIVTSQTTN